LRLLLPVLACAYGLGIVLGDAGLASAQAWLWLGVQAVVLGAVVRGARLRVAAAAIAACAAGGMALSARIEAALERPLASRVEAVVEARVDAVRSGASGPEVLLAQVKAIEPVGLVLPDRLLVRAQPPRADEPAWRPGSWLRVALRIAPVRGRTNPGGADWARALARRGIGGVASELHPLLRAEIAPPASHELMAALAQLRRRGAERLLREGPGGALLAALGLGEAPVLPPQSRRDLARLGLSHLVAVSGLHLWLVAGPAFLLAALALRRNAWLAARRDTRRVALVLALVVSTAYALFTGLAAPVQRALVFLALLVLAQLTLRRPVRSALFAAAALVVALLDCAAPFAPGVQLSFAATAALAWSAPAPERRAEGFPGALATSLLAALRISASATAATAPLVALHFGTVSPLGWLANAVAVPLTSLALLPLALAAGLTAVAQPELTVGLEARGLELAAQLAARALAAAAWLAARVPAQAGIAPGALGLALSCGSALLCVRASRSWLRLGLALLAAAAPGLGPAPALDPPVPRVVFLDVGQGDASIVQGERGSVLVDGGVAVPGGFDAGASVVLPALGALGIRRLDLVVASHADLDHAGGLAAVLRELPVQRLWLPPGGRSDPAFAALLQLAHARGVVIEERAAGDPALEVGDVSLEPLWPPRAAPSGSRNDGSLVLRVRLAGRSLLLPGDLGQPGERRLLERGSPLSADVLKLGHHGSRTSSSAALLQATSPGLAIVSAPLAGRFRMPHTEVIERLAAQGIPWCWTGRDGALLLGLGPRLAVRAFAADPQPSHSGARSDACSSQTPSSSSKPAGWMASPFTPRAAPRWR